jgi:hypothetical protein
MSGSEDWIELGVPNASVALKATGPAAYGHPARMRIRARSHEVERDCELSAVAKFCDEIGTLHRSLTGSARLESIDRDAVLLLTAHDDGHLTIDAEVGEHFGGPVEWDFRVRFHLDQSYLPTLALSLRAEFVNRTSQ